jgi:hypothetical protein
MKIWSKILGLLLIAALVTTPLATRALAEPDHASALPPAPVEHPPTCHTRGGNPVPRSPLPANYKCCLTGHDAAVVQASTSQQPPAQCTAVPPQIESLLTGYFFGGLEVSIVPSADPPGKTPLRI